MTSHAPSNFIYCTNTFLDRIASEKCAEYFSHIISTSESPFV